MNKLKLQKSLQNQKQGEIQRDLIHTPHHSISFNNNWISVKLSPLFSFEDNPLQSNPHQKKEPPQRQISRRGEWSHNSQLQSYPSQSQGTQKGSTNEASSNKTGTREQAPTIRCSIKNHHKMSKRVRWGSIPEESPKYHCNRSPRQSRSTKRQIAGPIDCKPNKNWITIWKKIKLGISITKTTQTSPELIEAATSNLLKAADQHGRNLGHSDQ